MNRVLIFSRQLLRFLFRNWRAHRRLIISALWLPGFVSAAAPDLVTAAAYNRTPKLAAEIALDVGHTVRDSGAISARGRTEFLFNQDLAQKIEKSLKAKGVRVRPINFDGHIESLVARPQAAQGSDFFLSIHHDSVQAELLETWQWQGAPQTYSDKYIGFSLFVSRQNPDLATSLRCASTIGALLQRAGFVAATHHADSLRNTPRPYADAQNAVHYYDNLVVLYRTTLPAVLFEAGIIKHRAEEEALRDPAQQNRMADTVATGLAACLSVGKSLQPDAN